MPQTQRKLPPSDVVMVFPYKVRVNHVFRLFYLVRSAVTAIVCIAWSWMAAV